MNVERPELRLIREKLESVLSPELASSVLFEALAEVGGRPPMNGDAALALVEGPLARVLASRAHAADADAIVADLLGVLRPIVESQPTPSVPTPRGRFRELEVTLEVTRGKGAVPVLVLSGSDELAARLEAALGPGRIATRTCTRQDQLESLARSGRFPPILLIDAIDFPPIEPVALAGLLEKTPRGTVHAIWGADLAYGSVVLSELVERRVPATPLDRREGIEPLLDLVRSRRAV